MDLDEVQIIITQIRILVEIDDPEANDLARQLGNVLATRPDPHARTNSRRTARVPSYRPLQM